MVKVEKKQSMRVKLPCARKELYRMVVDDLLNGEIIVLPLKEDEICSEGRRRCNGEYVTGVPHRSKEDCYRFCAIDGCDGL